MKTLRILLKDCTVVEKQVPTKIEEVVSIYDLGLTVMSEKERLYAAVQLSPTDMRYNEFKKYRIAWLKDIVELETLYKEVCYAYHNEPLAEVMERKDDFFKLYGGGRI
ncbi:hypothetical protein BJ4_287 [Bacillus phage BJ4]|nr:hypothetical protein BJ4_287 [Bacillus phage BJ4]AOZ62537.1 hypothetical protein SBP8a_287 [Bacillus phage SBP8a]UGO46533.1 hypothetical protein ABINADI_216 [Bacillus phage vB_BanH_Abinadi]